MIDKIKSALKTEYKGLGLSDKTIERLASYVKGLIENEDEIATAVRRDDVSLIATSIQGEIDGIRKAKQTAEEALETYKKSHPDKGGVEKKDEEGGSGKESDFEERLKALEERAVAAERKAAQSAALASVKTRLEADCKDAFTLKYVLKGFSFKEGETEDGAVERLKGEYNEAFKENRGKGAVPPFGGKGSDAQDSEVVERRKKLLQGKGLLEKDKS